MTLEIGESRTIEVQKVYYQEQVYTTFDEILIEDKDGIITYEIDGNQIIVEGKKEGKRIVNVSVTIKINQEKLRFFTPLYLKCL